MNDEAVCWCQHGPDSHRVYINAPRDAFCAECPTDIRLHAPEVVCECGHPKARHEPEQRNPYRVGGCKDCYWGDDHRNDEGQYFQHPYHPARTFDPVQPDTRPTRAENAQTEVLKAAWLNYHDAYQWGVSDQVDAAREAVERAVRAPLEARIERERKLRQMVVAAYENGEDMHAPMMALKWVSTAAPSAEELAIAADFLAGLDDEASVPSPMKDGE